LHENKVDYHITKKLWIIKTFWNNYLQDNYHFKDLNIWKMDYILEYRLKMHLSTIPDSKIHKKRSPNWIKTQM